jgi:chitinase
MRLRIAKEFEGAAALVIGFAVCGFALPATPAREKEPAKVFVGYVYQQPKKINFHLYTHLCHAFVVADADGKVRPSKTCPSRALVADAHKAGVKILLSLGGWGWDKQFAAIVSDAQAEDRYAKSVLAIVEEYDYDGIDLDWEYPDTKEEVVGFDRLSRRFRKELDALGRKKGRQLLQTMAASASPSTLQWLSNKLLLETMDWVNVMTYDYTGDRTSYAGHHSPLFASSKQPVPRRSTELTMKYLVDRGMPANRLAVGLPLYGKGFAVSEPYAATKKSARGQAPRGGNYSNIEKLIREKGWTRQWDDETKNPWAIAPDRSAVIGYDDAESLSLRTAWAMKQGFRGVFFWQIGGDQLPDGTNPLQAAARRKWEESVRTGPTGDSRPAGSGEGSPPRQDAPANNAFWPLGRPSVWSPTWLARDKERFMTRQTLVLASTLYVNQAPPADAAKEADKALDGAWQVVALEADGKSLELPPEGQSRVTFAGSRVTTGEGQRFAITVDPTTSPKLIDFKALTGDDKGRVLEGIYRLRGDTLTICVFGGEIRSRPTDFVTKAGSGCLLVSLKRQKD